MLQSETIHFYATNPQHMGELSDASIRYKEHNRLCGDDIEVFLVIEMTNDEGRMTKMKNDSELPLMSEVRAKGGGKGVMGGETKRGNFIIKEWSFVGNTSMITRACSGLFGDIVQGKTFEELFAMNQVSIIADTGITVSPRRERAQVLPLLATRNAIHEYLHDGIKDDFSDVMGA